jgi:hypothetical protein
VQASWLLCALPLVGCDVIWRLDGLDQSSDANLFSCDRAQHDEDNDGFADACDRCPGIADDQADADSDGVGDACDPDSTVLHEIALFVSVSAGSPPWRIVSGSWVERDDSLVYESFGQASYGIALYPGVVPEPPYVLEAHLSIDAIDPVTSVVGLLVDAETDGDGVTCGAIRRESPIRDLVRTQSLTGDRGDEKPISAIAPGGYRLTWAYDRASSQCAIAADDSSTAGGANATLGSPAPAGAIGLRSMRVGATVHYLVFYKQR